MTSVSIFTESGGKVGYGHAVRMGHLAEALRSRGAKVSDDSEADIGIFDFPEADPLRLEAQRLCFQRLVVVVGIGWTVFDRVRELADLIVYQGIDWPRLPKNIGGLQHLILGPEYAKPLRKSRKDQVCVCIGADVPFGYGLAVAEELAHLDIGGSLIVGKNHRRDPFAVPRGFRVAGHPDSLWPYLSRAECYVGTMGMAYYEAMASGAVPFVIGRTGDHVDTADRLQHCGHGFSLGLWRKRHPEEFAHVVEGYLGEREYLTRIRANNREAIDGHGAERIAKAILG